MSLGSCGLMELKFIVSVTTALDLIGKICTQGSQKGFY